MRLHVINTGFFKLDGGAMFGVVPKSIWQRTNPADDNNLCTWAMRSLLIEDGNKLILIDSGIGNKQDEHFLKNYYLHGSDSLITSLNQKGFSVQEVTDVFHTHLHFDHCGGSILRSGDKLSTTFPNATYWSTPDHWEWAVRPNAREKASFLKENILPMEESGQLKMIDPAAESPFPQFEIFFASGHTEKMMIPMISYKGHTICFMADLLPSVGHIPLPYVMGYDTRPLITLEEKGYFLNKAVNEKLILYFQHDPVNECCILKQTEKGPRLNRAFDFNELN
jgi:glyoxylase-like metal-dependent hydrolase (beta-lactamase superfamily II)